MNRQTYNDALINVLLHYMLVGGKRVITNRLSINGGGDLDVLMVDIQAIVKLFPHDKHRKAMLSAMAGLSDNEDDCDAVVNPSGPLWLSESHAHTGGVDNGWMHVHAIGFTPHGLDRVLALGLIPRSLIGAISHDKEVVKKVRSSDAFKTWLAGSWVDPTKAGPFKRLDLKTDAYSARTAIRKTAFVKQLSYTPEEAQKAYEFIEAANLRDRSKAAYKAHVSRRITA